MIGDDYTRRGKLVLVDLRADIIILILVPSRVGGTPGQEFINTVYHAILE